MNRDNRPRGTLRKEKDFADQLLAFSESITFDWLNLNRENIHQTAEFDQLIHLFPFLDEIFQSGIEKDSQEFSRTMIHTFQTQVAYNRICSGDFPESGLEKDTIKPVHELAVSLSSFSPLLIPIILWLHDIGRLEDKSRHHEKSAEMISRFNLLKDKDLSKDEIILIRKVVQYHLLIGTLYTGESSYMSFEPLLRDPEFQSILDNKISTKLFIDALTLFTMIDVWGYHINDISPTMIDNYFEIREEMEEIFAESIDLGEIMKRLKQKSAKHMDWRLMGYMMAFSKIGKKPHLTIDFYSGMIDDGFKRYIKREGLSLGWSGFKEKFLNKIDQVQFKYGLAVLIPLAYGGSGKRMRLTEDTKVNPNLFHLLACINNRISREEKSNTRCIPEGLWDVIFTGFPLWNQKTDFHQRLNEPGQIERIIDRGTVGINEKEGKNILSVDYSGIWQEI